MGTGSEMGGAWRSRSEFTGLLEVKIAAALTPGQGGATVEVDGGASRGGSVLREGLVVTDGERELDVADVERMSSRPRAPALGEKMARSGRSVLLGIRAAGWRTGGQQQIGERSAGAFVDRRAHDDGDGAGLVVGGGAGLVVGGGAGLVVSGGAGLVVGDGAGLVVGGGAGLVVGGGAGLVNGDDAGLVNGVVQGSNAGEIRAAWQFAGERGLVLAGQEASGKSTTSAPATRLSATSCVARTTLSSTAPGTASAGTAATQAVT
ncbi:hypothetical protein [uncultured Microbacterium sp.]|uniref:hypothetical protein n=1 Tax=uncultured Microbacterium sp. TaxID=191216 RepID=UPI0025F35D47|nr:hypothetical protein [uncultured Microbacterium sp.]